MAEEQNDAFSEHVEYFAKELTLDPHDLSETYKDKHLSLKVLFEKAHAARTSLAPPLLVTAIICGIAGAIHPQALWGAIPLSAVASYCFGLSDGSQSRNVADIVKAEVSNYRHSNGSQHAPALN